jgi:hypothetical protein
MNPPPDLLKTFCSNKLNSSSLTPSEFIVVGMQLVEDDMERLALAEVEAAEDAEDAEAVAVAAAPRVVAAAALTTLNTGKREEEVYCGGGSEINIPFAFCSHCRAEQCTMKVEGSKC